MWLYFGGLSSVGLVIYCLISWRLTRLYAASTGNLRSAIRFALFGATFMFLALWFACGIGGPPGNMLSADPTAHSFEFALNAALGSTFFSVPAWGCLLAALIRATHLDPDARQAPTAEGAPSRARRVRGSRS
jgi:hypothetical protein